MELPIFHRLVFNRIILYIVLPDVSYLQPEYSYHNKKTILKQAVNKN